MNVLFITSSFPRDSGDFAGRFVWEHAEALRSAGYQVRVLTWADEARSVWSPPGIRVVRVRYAKRGGEKLFFGPGVPERMEEENSSGLYTLAGSAMLAMLWETRQHLDWADVAVGHWLLPGGLVARVAAEAANVPSLVVGHSGAVHLLHRLPGPLRRPLVKLLQGPVTVSSPPLAEKAAGIGLDSRTLSMGFESTGAVTRGKSWLMMGRHVPIKGYDHGLRALAAAVPNAHVIIAGDGPDRPNLTRLAAKLGLDVEFVGMVTGAQKREVFERSRFVLFPSRRLKGRHEGLPVSLLEAADAGVIPLIGEVPGAETWLADVGRQQAPNSRLDTWSGMLSAADLSYSKDWSDAQRERVAGLEWRQLGPVWAELIRDVVSGYQRTD